MGSKFEFRRNGLSLLTWIQSQTEGIDDIQKWIQSQTWLQKLKSKLKQEDFDNFIGQTFQHKLSHRYLRKTDRKFRIKVHKHNKYCLKLENMKSKYTSGIICVSC